jgi:Regulator of chromosome condensation (RCC1) repeat
MTFIVPGFRTFGPLGLACLALIAAPPPAVWAQIVGPGVYAWGYNDDGQLGNGTASFGANPTPVPVMGLSGVNVTAVAGGADHSLAVTNTGAVYAWGANGAGELGNGNTNQSNMPVQVTGLSGVSVTAVAAGEFHSLAVTSTGAVYAWGYNDDGQLGNGNTTTSTTALLVTGGGLSSVNVTAVAGGAFHSLARTSAGAIAEGLDRPVVEIDQRLDKREAEAQPARIPFDGERLHERVEYPRQQVACDATSLVLYADDNFPGVDYGGQLDVPVLVGEFGRVR